MVENPALDESSAFLLKSSPTLTLAGVGADSVACNTHNILTVSLICSQTTALCSSPLTEVVYYHMPSKCVETQCRAMWEF